MYITPVPNADPRLDTYSYSFINAATNEIWIHQGSPQWSYVSNPDPAEHKSYRDYWYNAYISNTGKSGDAYIRQSTAKQTTSFGSARR